MEMIVRAIRGGFSCVGHSYAKANYPDVADFQPELKESCILTLDATNQARDDKYTFNLSPDQRYGVSRYISLLFSMAMP